MFSEANSSHECGVSMNFRCAANFKVRLKFNTHVNSVNSEKRTFSEANSALDLDYGLQRD